MTGDRRDIIITGVDEVGEVTEAEDAVDVAPEVDSDTDKITIIQILLPQIMYR